MFDEKSRGFGRPPIKEGASGHVCKSGEEKFARILPYPPPVKSLGAKTNHLPNIQGSASRRPLQEGPITKKNGWNRASCRGPRIEVILIPLTDRESRLPPAHSGGYRISRFEGGPEVENACSPRNRSIGVYSSANASNDFGLAADIMKSAIRRTISDLH